jgi:hypothetical protein
VSGYTKLFASILDSTVWDTPPSVRIVWITMLAMCDRDGIVEASVPGLARRAGVTRSECEEALRCFLSPDPDSRTKDYEGRRIAEVDGGWQLLNHDKYRERSSAEDKAEKNKIRQAKWRKRHGKEEEVAESGEEEPPATPGGNADVTPRNASNAMSRSVTQNNLSDHLISSASQIERETPAPESVTFRDETAPASSAKGLSLAKVAPKNYGDGVTLREYLRLGIVEGYERSLLMPAPRETSDPMWAGWAALAGWVVSRARLTGADERETAEKIVRCFLASPKAKAKGWPIPFLVNNCAEYWRDIEAA